MTGTTLTTAVTHGTCDASLPVALNAMTFGRIWGIAGNRYEISLCNNPGNTLLFITTNTTIPGVITCDDDGCGNDSGPSVVSFIPATTTTYRIYIFNTSFGTIYQNPTDLEVVITCISTTPPPNDDPCGAIPLTIDADCSSVSGTTEAATNSQFVVPGIGPAPSCTGALYQGADVWYSVTVPTNGLIGIHTQESTLCAGAFQLYTATACNGSFTQLAGGCIINGLTGPTSAPAMIYDAFSAGLAPGQVIYIRYWERNANENGEFGICAFEVNVPVNDQPCSAIAIPLNTSCIPIDSDLGFAYPSAIDSPGCGGNSINDIWYSVTVPNPMPADWAGLAVETSAASPVDLAMAWYRLDGSPCTPDDLELLACSATGSINSQAIGLDLLPGETIYVRIWGEVPWQGPLTICAYMNVAPPNDEPCGAIALPVNYGCLMGSYTNLAATQTSNSPPGTIDVPAPSCGTPTFADVWFTAEVPPNGILQFDMGADGLIDGAMAVYHVISGSCDANDLVLQQIAGACATGGSQQGSPEMPYLNVTGQIPGEIVYIRVWRQTANAADGTFHLCARRTDPPPGNCYYTLTMQDAAGNGWNGSYVTICIGGNCVNYTVTGASTTINIGANVGQQFTVSYTAVGGFQGENSYMISQFGQPVYVGNAPPPQGMVVNSTVSCDPPPPPAGDCLGAQSLCSNNIVMCQPYQNNSDPNELNSGNSGCLPEEGVQGRWFVINVDLMTPPCSPLAFDIIGGDQMGCGGPGGEAVLDFAVWGPFSPGSWISNICPIEQQPVRCNYASLPTPAIKGLAFDNDLPNYQYESGGAMAKHLVVSACEQYVLYVSNRDSTGQQFQIHWKVAPPAFQVSASDCPTPAPPGTYAEVGCPMEGGCGPVRVEQMSGSSTIIHPNPVTTTLRVTQAVSSPSTYHIIDPSGRLIVHGRLNRSNEIDVQHLDRGSYILRLLAIDGSDRSTHRFIKQ